jgi:long-chain acyl-CoA synthetase
VNEQPWLRHYDAQVPREVPLPADHLYGLLEQAARSHPRGTATLFYGARLDYRGLKRAADAFSGSLDALGVKRGDRVALILPNIPAYPIVHFGTLRIGAVLVPTNPLYVERELEHQLRDAGAETAVVFDKLYPRLAAVRERTPVKRVIVAEARTFLPPLLRLVLWIKERGGFRPNPSQGVLRLADLLRGPAGDSDPAPVTPDDTAILLYSGGTTGISKGAELTHRNALVNVAQVRSWLWPMQDRQETILCALPFFHSYGMTTALHLAPLLASTMLLLPRFDLNEVVARIGRHRPTIFCGVPSMYNAINHHPKADRETVGSIRLCVSGGSGLPEEVQKRFESLTGASLVEGYGLSEASPVTYVNPMAGRRKLGSIGLPIPGTEARIVDPETRAPLGPGREGELAVRGPQVMRRYWNRPEETAAVLHDGWLLTGDVAVMDEEGYFRIVDRRKDVIISAGMNIYPREIEEVLLQHPKVMEAAVIGIPSRLREEVVKAFLVARPGETVTRAEVLEFCRDKLARYKLPREIELRDALPKSIVGKVLKRVLREEERIRQEERGQRP